MFTKLLKRLFNRSNEKGQGLVEYALILVLVAVVAIVIMGTLGQSVQGVFCTVAAEFDPELAGCTAPADDEGEDQDEPKEQIWCETNGIGDGGHTYYELYWSDDGGTNWYYNNWQYWTGGHPECPFPHQHQHS